jgi:hypothetical protein
LVVSVFKLAAALNIIQIMASRKRSTIATLNNAANVGTGFGYRIYMRS